MAKTQLFTISLETFQTIEAGQLNYLIERMKEPLQEGQRIIIQAIGTDAEIETVITNVRTELPLHKGWYILSFPPMKFSKPSAAIGAPVIVFDPTPMFEDDTSLTSVDKSLK